jgi:hypothetical protein
MSTTDQQQSSKSEKKKTFKQYARKPEEAKAGTIPMLKYGKGNNFYKFKAALSKAALREYGNLGKLIEQEKYYVPVLDLPDYNAMGISAANIDFMKNEAMKELAKEVGKMSRDKPKLYGLIRQHMSVDSRDEVSQQPNYAVWHVEKDPEQLWQVIVRTHKVDCVSNVTEVMTLAARKAYQNIKQGAFEGLSLYSERFHETYRAYKATDSTSNPVVVKEEIQAMDFFHGLDNGRYGAFKTSMLNGWATKAVKPPKMANEIYRLAGSWVKQPTRTDGGGYAATYMTIEEEAKIRAKKANPKKPGKDKVNTPKKPAEKPEEEPKKETKDLPHIECFRCHEYGHYSSSKECPLHPKNQAKSEDASGFANATWQEE